MLIDFRERGREGEREKEKRPCKREAWICFLLHMPQPEIKPETWACALTGNQTLELSLYEMMLQPTEPGQGYLFFNI